MRPIARPLVAAAALIGLAAVPALASAATTGTHVMTVRLPDGMTAQIEYTGDTPPKIAFGPSAIDPIAMFERQTDAMFQALNAIPMPFFPAFGGLTEAAAPANGNLCSRSIQITYGGAGQQPHVVTQTAGNCGSAQPTAAPAPTEHAPTIEARGDGGTTPYRGLVRQIDWRR